MVAVLVLAFTYVAFAVGRVPGLRSDRVAAAIVGAVLLVGFGVLSVHEAQAAVDGATLGLLFGMMVLSAALEVSGTFGLIGWWVTRRARSPMGLLAAVAITSALLSAFLINDVVCIAFTPLVLRIANALDRDPKPYLLALATSSNIGSVATVTGNPQNILIASLSRTPYARFAAILGPIAAVALLVDVAVIAVVHRDSLRGRFPPRPEEKRPRIYARWARKSALVTALVLVAFLAGVRPVVAALFGAATMMLTRAVDPKRLYARVDWTLIALFTGLFVVVAGAEKVGVARHLLNVWKPWQPQSVWGLTAVTAVLSNVVSNVPAVMLLAPLVPHLPDPPKLWLTLAMSSTLAGNLTLPGSLATVIVAERAKAQVRLSFVDFLKVGAPTALVSLAVGAARLSFVH